jgi:hypothetical protein
MTISAPAFTEALRKVGKVMNLEDLQTTTWLKPWHGVGVGVQEAELVREVSSGHPLFGVQTVVVACRSDTDDVLFFLPGQERDLAMVHLTYNHNENSAAWPHTRFFDSFAEFEEIMKSDHEQWIPTGTDDKD